MELEKIRFKLYLVVFIVLLLVGIFGFMIVENLSLLDAIYFSIVTMATVGYGDIHPQYLLGKILAIVLIIGGVGTFLGIVASITDLFVKRREESLRLQKLNMVTGLFFSEMGNGLLRRFVEIDSGLSNLQRVLRISNEWRPRDFANASEAVRKHVFMISSRLGDLSEMCDYLHSHGDLLLRLLENPIVQEHGAFGDLLQAIFHLRDELLNRPDFAYLPDADIRHLEGDVVRVYGLLVLQWLQYMSYLKANYGYLFSLAMRLNPFDSEASAIIKGS